MGGDQVLDGGRARRSGRRGRPGRAPGRRRRPSREPASAAIAKPPERLKTSAAISTVTTVAATRWLNSITAVVRSPGSRPTAAQRPAVRAASGRAAAEAGVAHPDHAADHDQREGGERSSRPARRRKRASSSASPRAATRSHPGQATEASSSAASPAGEASAPSAVGARGVCDGRRMEAARAPPRPRCGRGSPRGCRAAARRCGRRGPRRSCATAAARARTTPGSSPPHGSCPTATPWR